MTFSTSSTSTQWTCFDPLSLLLFALRVLSSVVILTTRLRERSVTSRSTSTRERVTARW